MIIGRAGEVSKEEENRTRARTNKHGLQWKHILDENIDCGNVWVRGAFWSYPTIGNSKKGKENCEGKNPIVDKLDNGHDVDYKKRVKWGSNQNYVEKEGKARSILVRTDTAQNVGLLFKMAALRNSRREPVGREALKKKRGKKGKFVP